MEVCGFCASLVLGGECTNLNCEESRKSRNRTSVRKAGLSVKKTPKNRKTKKENIPKGAFTKYIQNDGTILVPTEIHLQYEVSLPNFMGYKSDKKTEQTTRRNVLKLLFESEFKTHTNALNQAAINEFGSPRSEKRKMKIISWLEGRIYRSKSKKILQNSREKLIADKEFIENEF